MYKHWCSVAVILELYIINITQWQNSWTGDFLQSSWSSPTVVEEEAVENVKSDQIKSWSFLRRLRMATLSLIDETEEDDNEDDVIKTVHHRTRRETSYTLDSALVYRWGAQKKINSRMVFYLLNNWIYCHNLLRNHMNCVNMFLYTFPINSLECAKVATELSLL